MNSQLEIKLAPTPESDKAKIAFTSLFANDDAYWIPYVIGKKLERERDEWQLNALLNMSVKQLSCMWCGEIVHAPTGYKPGNPLNKEQRVQAHQQHVATCPAHPIRDVERERDELILAVRGLKRAKGRFHTEQAAINLFELLP